MQGVSVVARQMARLLRAIEDLFRRLVARDDLGAHLRPKLEGNVDDVKRVGSMFARRREMILSAVKRGQRALEFLDLAFRRRSIRWTTISGIERA